MVGAVGGIAGMGYGAIENCSANASVTSNGKNMQGLGLICGDGKWLTVRACTAEGNVTAKGFGAFSVGGLVGCIQESPVMENCAVKATIDASDEKSFMVEVVVLVGEDLVEDGVDLHEGLGHAHVRAVGADDAGVAGEDEIGRAHV